MSINDLPLRRGLGVSVVALLVLLSTAEIGVAQRRVSSDSLRQIQSVAPLSGPPGTQVSVFTENLPLQARIYVGVGATHAGFEVLTEGTQGEWGDIRASLRIPASATWDRPLVIILFNGVFSPIGISEPFHVTDADGMVRRTGRITDEGGGCVTMRDGDDYLYTLTGELGSLRPGDEVTVEGAYAESSSCDQGHTVQVVRVVAGT